MFPFADADVRQRSFPIVNVAIIGLNALVFLYELALSGGSVLGGGGNLDITAFFHKFGFIPDELTRAWPAHTIFSPLHHRVWTGPVPPYQCS